MYRRKGGGPAYVRVGNGIFYFADALDEWAAALFAHEVRNTTEEAELTTRRRAQAAVATNDTEDHPARHCRAAQSVAPAAPRQSPAINTARNLSLEK
jgi:hypothetical protein